MGKMTEVYVVMLKSAKNNNKQSSLKYHLINETKLKPYFNSDGDVQMTSALGPSSVDATTAAVELELTEPPPPLLPLTWDVDADAFSGEVIIAEAPLFVAPGAAAIVVATGTGVWVINAAGTE